MREINLLLEKLQTGCCWERKGHIADLISYPEGRYIATVEQWLRNGGDVMLRNIAMDIYRALGSRAHASLISLLREGDADVRGLAAILLGDIRDRDAASQLMDGLTDSEVNVKVAAAEALGKIGEERAVCALAESLNGSPWEAMAAIEAIGSIGGESALHVLHECMEWENYQRAVEYLVESLGKAPGNRVIMAKIISMAGGAGSLLPFAADDGDPGVRTELALALGHLGTPESKEALCMLRNDPAEEVRAAAKKSMIIFCKDGACI